LHCRGEKPQQGFKNVEIENHKGFKNFCKVQGVLEPPITSGGSELPVSSGGSRIVGK